MTMPDTTPQALTPEELEQARQDDAAGVYSVPRSRLLATIAAKDAEIAGLHAELLITENRERSAENGLNGCIVERDNLQDERDALKAEVEKWKAEDEAHLQWAHSEASRHEYLGSIEAYDRVLAALTPAKETDNGCLVKRLRDAPFNMPPIEVALRDAAADRIEALERALREQHSWHMQSGSYHLPDGHGGFIELDAATEYADSTMCERTMAALSGTPVPDALVEAKPMTAREAASEWFSLWLSEKHAVARTLGMFYELNWSQSDADLGRQLFSLVKERGLQTELFAALTAHRGDKGESGNG